MYYLTENGGGYTSDNTLPNGAVECTEEQATSGMYKLIEGKPVASVDIAKHLRDFKTKELSSQCKATLLSGFFSSALGENCMYGSTECDQRNLLTLSTINNGGKLYCLKQEQWQFMQHSPEQVKKVLTDWMIFLQANQTKLAQLTETVNSMDLAEIDKVNWHD